MRTGSNNAFRREPLINPGNLHEMRAKVQSLSLSSSVSWICMTWSVRHQHPMSCQSISHFQQDVGNMQDTSAASSKSSVRALAMLICSIFAGTSFLWKLWPRGLPRHLSCSKQPHFNMSFFPLKSWKQQPNLVLYKIHGLCEWCWV